MCKLNKDNAVQKKRSKQVHSEKSAMASAVFSIPGLRTEILDFLTSFNARHAIDLCKVSKNPKKFSAKLFNATRSFKADRKGKTVKAYNKQKYKKQILLCTILWNCVNKRNIPKRFLGLLSRDLLLSTITQDPMVLRKLENLHNDMEAICIGIKSNPNCFRFASPDLIIVPQVYQMYFETSRNVLCAGVSGTYNRNRGKDIEERFNSILRIGNAIESSSDKTYADFREYVLELTNDIKILDYRWKGFFTGTRQALGDLLFKGCFGGFPGSKEPRSDIRYQFRKDKSLWGLLLSNWTLPSRSSGEYPYQGRIQVSLLCKCLWLGDLKDQQKEKELLLKIITQNGAELGNLHEDLKNDRELAMISVASTNGGKSCRQVNLQYVGWELKKDAELVNYAVSLNTDNLLYADISLKSNKKFISNLILELGFCECCYVERRARVQSICAYMDTSLRSDKEIMLQMASVDRRLIKFASLEIRLDKSIWGNITDIGPSTVAFVPLKLWEDQEFTKDRILDTRNYYDQFKTGKKFSAQQRDDLAYKLNAAREWLRIITPEVSQFCLEDFEILKALCSFAMNVLLKYITLNCKESLLVLIEIDPWAYDLISDPILRLDDEIVHATMKRSNGKMFYAMPEQFRFCADFIKDCVKNYSGAINHLPRDFLAENRELVKFILINAVDRKDTPLLGILPSNLRSDYEICMLALSSSANNWRFISNILLYHDPRVIIEILKLKPDILYTIFYSTNMLHLLLKNFKEENTEEEYEKLLLRFVQFIQNNERVNNKLLLYLKSGFVKHKTKETQFGTILKFGTWIPLDLVLHPLFNELYVQPFDFPDAVEEIQPENIGTVDFFVDFSVM